MRGRVVVSSFHSTSVKYIEDYCPDFVISLDSHPDTFVFGLTRKLMEVAESMPQKLRDAVLRPSAHALMRRRMPDVEIFVVVPLTCLRSATLGEFKHTHRVLGSHRIIDESREVTQKRAFEFQNLFVEKILKMKLHTSPPNSLKKLAEKVRGEITVIDIDVDYMADAQGECYTMAPGLEIKDGVVIKPRKSELGSADRVLKLIKLTKPELITVSEAKLEALHTANSFTDKFLRMMQALRYKVEYGPLLDSDDEAYNLIEKHEDFVNEKLAEIERKYIGHLTDEGQIEKKEGEIAKAMREHFLKKRANT